MVGGRCFRRGRDCRDDWLSCRCGLRLQRKFLLDLLDVDLADGTRDRLRVRRDIAALLQECQHIAALHIVLFG
jgi:hypothetical protein